ncbi:MAG TPA: tetratricopeptide repeat protein [Chthonomonadales bacterium]|nr:tetratricopeptide repeat protein [Chthonomonadales bacterium]
MTGRRAIAPWLLFFGLASSLCAQPAALDQGVKLIREGRFDQALIKLEQAHRAEPRNATIENLLGITETKLGHIDEANKHYRSAIRMDAAQAAPHRNLGFNLLTAKDYTHAEPELREAARLDPGDGFAHYYLLLLALATDKDAEAINEASAAGKIVDNDPDTIAHLAQAEIRIGREDDALHRIEHLEQSGQLTSVREYQLAILFTQHDSYSQAVHCFQRMASLDPSWPNRYNLALALLYAGQPTDASALLTGLRAEQPHNADILMYLGSAFEMQQKMPEALEAYQAAAAADPSNPDRMLDYTRLLMDTDRYDDAIQVIQSGMSETAATAPLQLRLGAIEMIKGNYDAARDAFRSALATDPELDVAYVGLAQTYAREANDAEAINILQKARERRPGHYLLEYYFGLLASRLGRGEEAAVSLEKAAQLEPQSPDPFFELGKLHETQQDWPQARQALEHVIELNPQFVPAHYQLSRVYEHLGLKTQAAQEAQKTHALVDAQRVDALRRQRERAGSFQPQAPVSQTP